MRSLIFHYEYFLFVFPLQLIHICLCRFFCESHFSSHFEFNRFQANVVEANWIARSTVFSSSCCILYRKLCRCWAECWHSNEKLFDVVKLKLMQRFFFLLTITFQLDQIIISHLNFVSIFVACRYALEVMKLIRSNDLSRLSICILFFFSWFHSLRTQEMNAYQKNRLTRLGHSIFCRSSKSNTKERKKKYAKSNRNQIFFDLKNE